MSDDFTDEHPPLEPIDEEFDDLAEAAVVPPQWVIKDLLPAGITFLAAPPKTGKSTLTVAMAAMVAGYKCDALPEYLRDVPNDGPVFMFSAEAMAGEIRYIAETGLGIKLIPNEAILVAKYPERYRVDQTEGAKHMMHWLESRHPRLVIMDPLRNFHGEDENDSGVMIRMLSPLRRWAIEHKASFVVVHHTNKPKEGQTHYTAQDMRGSSAMFGIADAVLIVSPGKHANQVRIEATFKRAKGWERNLQISAYDDRGKQAGELLDALDHKVLGLLCNGVIWTAQTLADECKTDVRRVTDSLFKLLRNGKARLDGNDWTENYNT